MNANSIAPAVQTFVTIKGKWTPAPAFYVNDTLVAVTGKCVKTASIHDEEWIEAERMEAPKDFVAGVQAAGRVADVFSFGQRAPLDDARLPFHMDLDNLAVADTRSSSAWWERLPQVTRKNVRRSAKRGVTTAEMDFNQQTVASIYQLYQSIQLKQGQRFAHHGKDLATVERELSTYRDRAAFIGAFCDGELIGFIKLVFMKRQAAIMHLVTRDEDYDKRPGNALVAKAVEVCERRGIEKLIYGKYVYGNKTNSPLTEFKRRMGFEKVDVPRYYVPLTFKGRIVVVLRLYRGLLGWLPSWTINLLLWARATAMRITYQSTSAPAEFQNAKTAAPTASA